MKNNKQSGVALVTVLLVAAVTIALAYGALTVSLNTLQGSKAAESSVQARLNAESGLDATFVYLEREFENKNQNPFSSPTSSTPIPSVISSGGITIDREALFNLHNDPSHQTDSDGNEIYEVIVDGYGPNSGLYTTKANVYYNPGSEGSTDPNATPEKPTTVEDILYRGITSCSVVETTGGTNILGGGNIFSGKPITLSSGSEDIEGNLYTPETISITSTKIEGNITAGKTVTINNGSGDKIVGDIRTNGSIEIINSSHITGSLFTNQNLNITNVATIYGDIFVGGNLTITNTAKIVGNIYVNGKLVLNTWNIEISGDVFTNQFLHLRQGVKVNGNVFAGAGVSMEQSNTVIQNNLYAAQGLTMGSGTTINGSAFVDGNTQLDGHGYRIMGDLYTSTSATEPSSPRVRGRVIFEASAGSSRINAKRAEGLPPKAEKYGVNNEYKIPNVADFTVCDIPGKDITITDDVKSLINSSTFAHPGIPSGQDASWEITPGKLKNTGTSTEESIPLQTGLFADQPVSFMHFDRFELRNSTGNKISISGGNVVLLINQKVSVENLTNLSIAPGSSLTIITPSQIEFTESGGDSTWSVLNSEDRPSLSFYTSYGASPGQSEPGFRMSGGNKRLNALVYSPTAPVDITDSELHGAVVGASVEVNGSGTLRFHQGLLDLIGKRGSSPSNGEEGLVIVKRR